LIGDANSEYNDGVADHACGGSIMSLTGHVQNGVVVFDAPNGLPDGTAVKVEAIETPAKTGRRSLLDRLGDVVGKAEGLPADASQNVDHYLYGHPKK
jgi:hypothetical protein